MKKLLLVITMVVIAIDAMAQATSLVVDNQTPGWLSNKINYGDQQTLVNLTVTGYINQTDVDFINQLIGGQQLHGRLDLSDVEIVGSTRSDDNKMTGYNRGELCCIKGTLKHLLLPKKLQSANRACYYAYCDTITLGSPLMNHATFSDYFGRGASCTMIKNLIFREGIDSIGTSNSGVYGGEGFELANLVSINLPSTLKQIAGGAFANLQNLQKVNLPDSIEEIGRLAFRWVPAFKDTVFLPLKLKTYNVNSFIIVPYGSGEKFKNQHVIIPNNVSTIDFEEVSNVLDTLNFYINNPLPPSIKNIPSKNTKHVNVYLPKALINVYESDENWSKFNLLIEPNPANKIILSNEAIKVKKAFSYALTATVLPDDADTKDVIWQSGNTTIASVNSEGVVTGHSSGQCYIYVTLVDNNSLKDSCLVTVYQPVSNVQLNNSEKDVKVGESFDLTTTVSPYDADDKSVVWTSDDNGIATVVDGKVTGVKAGKVKITATSVSNSEVSATCDVTVLQPVEGIKLDRDNYTLSSIGETVQLVATVLPEDASNKNVNWRSSEEKVCMVSNGKVVAVGYGTSVIMATTADGGYMAVCTVNVDSNATGIESISFTSPANYEVYDVEGNKLNSLRHGINIVKFQNGKVKKVVIK